MGRLTGSPSFLLYCSFRRSDPPLSLAFLIMRKFFPIVASAALSLGLGLTAASYQQRIMAAPSAAAAAPFAAPFLLFFSGASASLLLGCAAAGDAAGRRS